MSLIEIDFNPDWGHEERVEHMLRLGLHGLVEIQQEIKKVMATQAELEQGIQDVITVVGTLGDAVTAAADRVIESLKNTGIDLTPQITELTNLKGAVSAAVDQVNAIDPTTAEAPVEEPTSSNDAPTAGDAVNDTTGN